LLALLPACSGSELAWYGHTPDRAARVELRRDGGGEWLTVGRVASVHYERIALESLTFGPGGRWAVAALGRDSRGRRGWRVVGNAGEGEALAGVAEVQFTAAGRLAYAAKLGTRWTVVVDGRFGIPSEGIVERSIATSPDGRRVAYVAIDGPCQRLIEGRRPGPCRDEIIAVRLGNLPALDAALIAAGSDGGARLVIGEQERGRFRSARSLELDPSGTHWAVIASPSPSRWQVVVDGRPGPAFDEVRDVVWAAGGRELAYTARIARAWFVVHGDQTSRPYLRVEAPLYSPDGGRLAWIGRTASESEAVIDGVTVWRASTEATAVRWSPRGDEIGFVYRRNGGAVLAVGARRFPFDIVVERTLRFSADGKHWAALVGSRSERKLFIAIDGRHRIAFDSTELFGGGLVGEGAPLERIGAWVAAELDRYLEGRTPA
jgi:hypothetical protein